MAANAFYRYVAIPFVDLVRKTDSLRVYRQMDQTQWLDRETLDTLQIERLRSLLKHAGQHVPYYRDLFAESDFHPDKLWSVSDLAVLPFLDKKIIRQEGHRLKADNATQFGPRPHRSAGTTGQPIEILIDRMRHSIGWADMYRWWNAGGWKPGQKQFVLAGAALRSRRLSSFKARLYGKLNHFEEFTSFGLDEKVMDRLLERLNKPWKTVYLRGYASSIHTLARYAAEVGWVRRSDTPVVVFTTAETLFAEQRRQIETGLNAHVFDQWGCRDGGISAFECEQHCGLHLATENTVVEICRDGRPVPDGESGEVIATDLFSYAMPIIRYRVGDVASYAADSCSCGRGLPLISSVEGRVSGFLIGSGGRRIHGEFFSHVFWETPWVKEFQVEQNLPEEIVVKIIPSSEPPSDKLEEIQRLMSDQAGPEVRIRIEFVNEIPPGPMGKRQFIICRVPQ